MFGDSIDDALSTDIFFIQFRPCFHGEIIGITWRSFTGASRCYFRDNDDQLIFFSNGDVSEEVMLEWTDFGK